MSIGLLSETSLELLDDSLDLIALREVLSKEVRGRALQLLSAYPRMSVVGLDAQTPQQLDDVMDRINQLPPNKAVMRLRELKNQLPLSVSEEGTDKYSPNERPLRKSL